MSDIRYISNYTGEAIDSAINKAQKLPSITAANSGQILIVNSSELQSKDFTVVFNDNYNNLKSTIIDLTLTDENKAAGAQAVGNKFDNVEYTLGTSLVFKATFESGYISTAPNGSTMSSFNRTTSSDWVSAVIPVSEGDKVIVTAFGSGTEAGRGAFAYAIVQGDKTVISKSTRNGNFVDVSLIMPQNAAYLIVNNEINLQPNYYAIKGKMDYPKQLAEMLDTNLTLAHRRLDDIWVYGRVDGQNGSYLSATTARRRTVKYCGVKEGIFAVTAEKDYSFFVFAFSRDGNDTYIGAWDNTNQNWVRSTTGFNSVKYYNFSTHPEYKYKLVLCKGEDNSEYIDVNDIIEVYFDVSPVNNNITKVNQYENMLSNIVQPAIVDDSDISCITFTVDSSERISKINNAKMVTSTSAARFGTFSETTNNTVYYVSIEKDSIVFIETTHSPCTCRASLERPVISTAAWTGQAGSSQYAWPSRTSPWIVPAGYYIAVGVENEFQPGEKVNICTAPIKYGLSSTIIDMIHNMILAELS